MFTRLEVGVDEADAEAEAKRVSRLTLLEADGKSLEKNLSKYCPSLIRFHLWP